MEEFDKLHYITKILRKNCPSDKARTTKEALSFLKDEIKEVEEAIQNNNIEHIIEELGDLFWNVLFLIHIESEDKNFKIEKVLDKISNKMHFRHPHVFKDKRNISIEESQEIWEKQKRIEKEQKIIH